MSNDLISRSALLKEMAVNRTFKLTSHEYEYYKHMVENMPVAYDVDKVVEQIKGDEGFDPWQTVINEGYAIEIVRAGGV